MNELWTKFKVGSSVFLTNRIEDNGRLEAAANMCLRFVRKKDLALLNGKYVITKKYPSGFTNKKIDLIFTISKFAFLSLVVVIPTGASLKALSWTNRSVRKRNLDYIRLKLKDGKNQELIPFIVHMEDLVAGGNSLLTNLTKDLIKSIFSLLDFEDAKQLRLTTKKFVHIFDFKTFRQFQLEKRYPINWIKQIGIEKFLNFPTIKISSEGIFPIEEPIRCIQFESLKTNPIVHGSHNHIPFLAVHYYLEHDEQHCLEGLLILWKPPFDWENKPNHSWINAKASCDFGSIGSHFEKESSSTISQQGILLDFLAQLMNGETYHFNLNTTRFSVRLSSKNLLS